MLIWNNDLDLMMVRKHHINKMTISFLSNKIKNYLRGLKYFIICSMQYVILKFFFTTAISNYTNISAFFDSKQKKYTIYACHFFKFH